MPTGKVVLIVILVLWALFVDEVMTDIEIMLDKKWTIKENDEINNIFRRGNRKK